MLIVLIGCRGSGKSTLGAWLAGQLQVPFFDSDDEVLHYHGFKTVTDAFHALGEEGWRNAELEVIQGLFNRAGVLSLGGGSPMISQLAQEIQKLDCVIHLFTDEETMISRINEGEDRPLLKHDNMKIRIERMPKYTALATKEVNTSCSLKEAQSRLFEAIK